MALRGEGKINFAGDDGDSRQRVKDSYEKSAREKRRLTTLAYAMAGTSLVAAGVDATVGVHPLWWAPFAHATLSLAGVATVLKGALPRNQQTPLLAFVAIAIFSLAFAIGGLVAQLNDGTSHTAALAAYALSSLTIVATAVGAMTLNSTWTNKRQKRRD